MNTITDYLIQEKIISEEEKNIYLYGLTLFFKYIVSMVLIILLGVMTRSLREVLIVIVLCLPLRSYGGGIHLKKESLCLICSVVIIQVIVMINRLFSFNIAISIILSLVSCLLIYLIGPVDNKNKPLDNIENKIFKSRLNKVLFIQLSFLFLMILLDKTDVARLIALSFCVNVLSMILGKYFRKRDSKFVL